MANPNDNRPLKEDRNAPPAQPVFDGAHNQQGEDYQAKQWQNRAETHDQPCQADRAGQSTPQWAKVGWIRSPLRGDDLAVRNLCGGLVEHNLDQRGNPGQYFLQEELQIRLMFSGFQLLQQCSTPVGCYKEAGCG